MLLRSLLPLSLTVILISSDSVAGTSIGDPIRGDIKNGLRSHVGIQGRVGSLKWTSRTGRTTTQRLLSPMSFDGQIDLTVPMGEWTDVTLIFDGPVDIEGDTASGEALFVSAELDRLTISFDEPVSGAGQVQRFAMDVTLPSWLSLITDQGTAVLEQGDATTARLAAALEDGMVLRGL